jgi:metal-responsive CopG/Arc/MetJ family transcriptional regulator
MDNKVRAKASVALPRPLLIQIDKLIGEGASRSDYIEKVLSDHLREVDWRGLQIRDMERINANAEELNAEAMDVLTYQTPIF